MWLGAAISRNPKQPVYALSCKTVAGRIHLCLAGWSGRSVCSAAPCFPSSGRWSRLVGRSRLERVSSAGGGSGKQNRAVGLARVPLAARWGKYYYWALLSPLLFYCSEALDLVAYKCCRVCDGRLGHIFSG